MNKLIVYDDKQIGKIIASAVEEFSEKNEKINVGIPGGRSVKSIINFINELNEKTCCKIHIFLVDERLEKDFNQTEIMKELKEIIEVDKIKKTQIHFPEITGNDKKDFQNFDELMNANPLNLVILSVGEDCHIASIFPQSNEITSDKKTSIILSSPKPPNKRVTLTLNGLKNSKKILIFLKGKEKALDNYENNKNNPIFPASYFKEATVITNIE